MNAKREQRVLIARREAILAGGRKRTTKQSLPYPCPACGDDHFCARSFSTGLIGTIGTSSAKYHSTLARKTHSRRYWHEVDHTRPRVTFGRVVFYPMQSPLVMFTIPVH